MLVRGLWLFMERLIILANGMTSTLGLFGSHEADAGARIIIQRWRTVPNPKEGKENNGKQACSVAHSLTHPPYEYDPS